MNKLFYNLFINFGNNMKRVIFFFDVGVYGIGGATDAQEFEDDISDQELYNIAWEYAVNNAESHGYYPPRYYPRYYDDSDDSDDYYTDSIDGWWEEYIPEKHDKQKPGGGKWFD